MEWDGPPSRQQLYRHAICCAVPMVGFGFMDNLVMIQMGDLIDSTLGLTFGLSTLTAAAYGQVVSDVSGTLFGNTIDAFASRIGLPSPQLTHEQLRMRATRAAGMGGAVVGVTLGCLLGMLSLLMMDLDKRERLQRQRELRTLFSTLMEEGHSLIGADYCSLQLVDSDGKHVFSMGMRGKPPSQEELDRAFQAYDLKASGSVDVEELAEALQQLGWQTNPAQVEQMLARYDAEGTGQLHLAEFRNLMSSIIYDDEVKLRVREGGTRHRVLTTGQMLNIKDVSSNPLCANDAYKLRGYDVRSVLIGPVLDQDGRVIGLVELVNKKAAAGHGTGAAADGAQAETAGETAHLSGEAHGFTRDDERLLEMLCAHCSIFLRSLS